MTRYAWRTLVQGKGRMVLSIGGVALALILIIGLDAVFLGAERQSTAYIDRAGADIVVSQAGVRTMHMGTSTLPMALANPVRAIPGVDSVTPVAFASDIVRIGATRANAYVIGLPPDADAGMPPEIVAGKALPDKGGALVDQRVAERAGLGLGDTVTVLGRPFRIEGLSRGTAGFVNSVVIVPQADVATVRGNDASTSFLFVRVAPGTSAKEVAEQIQSTIDGVTVQTRQQFASEERALIRDMGTSVISVMNLLGLLVGLAVMALTVYLAMMARRPEFGMLKAIGARNTHLYRVVILQAFASVGAGLAVAVGITFLLALLLPRLGSSVELAIGGASLARTLVASFLIAGLAALLPIKRIGGLDPAMVFRGG